MLRIRSALVLLTAGLLLGPALPAAAEPATSIAYPVSATATRYVGLAFDTCTAPTYAQMTAWKASPYRAIGIYIGGVNRGCAQPQLTASWVSSVTKLGWRLIPIYMGYQAPCTFRPNAVKMTGPSAATQGTSQAADAIAKAKALGILPGSAIYGDMEHYNATDTTCRATVLRYLSSWTKEMHRQGYVSAVYAHQNSGARHLAEVYNSTSYARPDALWIARWDLNSAVSTLTNWPLISNRYWLIGQRAKQYRGDHLETYGGVTLNIDNDRLRRAGRLGLRTPTRSGWPCSPDRARHQLPGDGDPAGQLRRTGRVPDLRHEDRHQHRLGQADQRHVRLGLLRPDAVQHRLQRADPRVQLRVPDDHRQPCSPEGAEFDVREVPGAGADRLAGVGHLPASRRQGRYYGGVGPADRR